MKKIFEILIFCLLLALAALVMSCGGSRKVNKQYHEIKSNYSFNDSSYILTQNVRLNDIEELVPIDNTKPFFVDGKEYFNVSIKFDKSKFNDFELNQTYIGTVNGKSEITDNEETIRKDNTWLYLGIVLIIGCLVFIWFYLPKLKTGI